MNAAHERVVNHDSRRAGVDGSTPYASAVGEVRILRLGVASVPVRVVGPRYIGPMKRIAVTGSSGFIGRLLCRSLARVGITVHAVDICPEHAEATALTADVVAALDGVVHLGGMSRVVWGEAHPERCMDLNATHVARLLRLVQETNPHCWFLLASSKEVYGDSGTAFVREDAELRPKSVYARSKLQAEHLVQEAALRGLRGGIVRLSTVYGAFGDHEGRLIPKCVSSALTRQVFTVDSETVVLDPTHVDDVVRGLVRFTEYLDALGPAGCTTMNLCAGRGLSIREIVRTVSDCAPWPLVTRPGVPRSYMGKAFVGDNAKAKAVLGWEPTIIFTERLHAYMEAVSQLAEPAKAFRADDLVQRLLSGR